MNIDLIAKLKDAETFFHGFNKGDEKKLFSGRSLLLYALSNQNPEARYAISCFLIESGADVNSITEDNFGVFHILFSRPKQNIGETVCLAKLMIDRGADINLISKDDTLPLHEIVIMKYTDEDLMPLYDLWFSQPIVLWDVKNYMGYTPLDLARKNPYRKELVKKIETLSY